MIAARRITKRYGKTVAVHDVSFTVKRGDAVALWGSNGAGKTTLIRCMLGLVRFRGKVTIGDCNVKRHGKKARRLIGYVPQELAFHDDMRLGSAMALFASLRRVELRRCAELLEQVELAGFEKRRVRDLSGGMKQRLALAVGMLSDPPIIILDEPTSNLDAAGRSEVMKMLQHLKLQGKTIVFSSHRPDEVTALATRVLVMKDGKLISDISPAELWPTSQSKMTMRLYVADQAEQSALTLLKEAGQTVQLNGHGLCVTIEQDRKMLPIDVLLKANIQVRDFDVLTNESTDAPTDVRTHAPTITQPERGTP